MIVSVTASIEIMLHFLLFSTSVKKGRKKEIIKNSLNHTSGADAPFIEGPIPRILDFIYPILYPLCN